jgi:hypothetical protein
MAKETADVIELKILKWEDRSGLLRWNKGNHNDSHKRVLGGVRV